MCTKTNCLFEISSGSALGEESSCSFSQKEAQFRIHVRDAMSPGIIRERKLQCPVHTSGHFGATTLAWGIVVNNDARWNSLGMVENNGKWKRDPLMLGIVSGGQSRNC
jgi:nitrite reductase/ring-hydroxylating ferredoxin subunit